MVFSFKHVVILVGIFLAVLVLFSASYIVPPGHRGIAVTMGKVSPQFRPEGFGFKQPLITTIRPISVQQMTGQFEAACYSSDLQHVNIDLRILFRIPENSVVKIYRDYAGDPFETLIVPRVSEALKEVTATRSAEMIVKNREEIKQTALKASRDKIGDVLTIEDLVIHNVALSAQLEHAIEAKMVQEQEAAKARFIQQKTEIEAATAIIRAKGEAEAIRIRGLALRDNPALVNLQIVEKWDGHTPQVVGGGQGANILLPLNTKN